MEFLKGVLSDDTYAKLEAELKDNKDIKLGNLAKGDYVGKDKFASLEEQTKAMKAQVEEANKQIEAFKGMDIEGAKKAADEYKAKFEQSEKDYTTKLSEMQLSNALDKRLTADKVKDSVAVKAHLKMDLLKLDGDNLIGYDDQIKALKASEATAYHFGGSEAPPTITKPMGNGTTISNNPIKFNFAAVPAAKKE